jgi:Ca-activated chloride channel homolog
MFDSSGIVGLLADFRKLAGEVRFLHPWAFWLIVVPVVLTFATHWAARRTAQQLPHLGTLATLLGLLTRPITRRWGMSLLLGLAWLNLILGIAGPTWGEGETDGVVLGRDLVIVLDMSRSMLAADTVSNSRFESAVQASRDLVENLRGRGGHRVGVVIFAAQAQVWVPLTADYDHVAQKLLQLDCAHPPIGVRPTESSRSGTRLGEGLRLAIATHDERFPGSQDIILLSDGDDPVNDQEWKGGLTAARRARVPIHVAGIGDPNPEKAATIILEGNLLESPDDRGIPQPVRTFLNEPLLKSLAEESGGAYLPSRKEVPTLNEFFRQTIEGKPSRELSDDALPQRANRSSWFLIASLGCWLAFWWRSC